MVRSLQLSFFLVLIMCFCAACGSAAPQTKQPVSATEQIESTTGTGADESEPSQEETSAFLKEESNSISGEETETAEATQPLPSASAAKQAGVAAGVEQENVQKEQPSAAESVPLTTEKESSKILIAYFTWAENTHVDDPSMVDVDATTSASVLIPGNVGLLAQWIAEETGGDTFSIITEESYSSDYDICLNRAIEEHDAGERPAITGHVDNISDYDIVFLGFPNWWYSCPMAILTFIEENDLSGKTIIPFCSHGTGGFAASLRDIGAFLPENCTVLDEFGAYRPEVAQSQDELLEWLSGLDIEY